MTINDPAVLAELQVLNQCYEAALMANDLDTLDALFWQSPHVLRFGVGENLHGIEEIAAFRAARPGGSPQRRVTRVSIAAFGRDHGVINVEFERADGTRGRQSQSWARLDEGWRIAAAHVSLLGAAP